MIDLGCRSAVLTRDLSGVWMDIDLISESPRNSVHGDIRLAPDMFLGSIFEIAILTDVIEHLTKSDGLSLIERLPRISSAILLFTPVDYIPTPAGVSPHGHLSSWYPEEMWINGWTVWEWPTFHRELTWICGAFFAWKFDSGVIPVEQVATASGVPI